MDESGELSLGGQGGRGHEHTALALTSLPRLLQVHACTAQGDVTFQGAVQAWQQRLMTTDAVLSSWTDVQRLWQVHAWGAPCCGVCCVGRVPLSCRRASFEQALSL